MKTLAINIESKGYFYKQELRNENFAIYSQWLNNDLIAYELIRIRKNKESMRFGKIIDASESYPNERQWGVRGWTIKSFNEANKKFLSLTEELANSHSPRSVESICSLNPILSVGLQR